MRRMVKSTHHHPKPNLDRITQYGALTLAAVMVVSAPLQILLTLLGAPGGLFVLTALITLILVPIVVMPTTTAPGVTLEADGIWIEPLIWPRHFVEWEHVQAAKEYPLMQQEHQEVTRRALVGRKNYTAPEGIMLVIDSLPLYYRITAFFAGESGHSVIALTNRTHTEYPKLKKKIIHYVGEIQPHA